MEPTTGWEEYLKLTATATAELLRRFLASAAAAGGLMGLLLRLRTSRQEATLMERGRRVWRRLDAVASDLGGARCCVRKTIRLDVASEQGADTSQRMYGAELDLETLGVYPAYHLDPPLAVVWLTVTDQTVPPERIIGTFEKHGLRAEWTGIEVVIAGTMGTITCRLEWPI